MVKKIVTLLIGTILMLLVAGCSKRTAGVATGTYLRIFPEPPDTTRIQYLTTINSSEDVKPRQSGFNKFLFGVDEPLPVIKPYGIAADSGILYICDTGLKGVIRMDLEKGSFDYFIPGGKGQLQLPINCDLDADGNLFVADGDRKQIVVFGNQGNYINAFGESDLFKPTDVKVSGGKVWVANIANHRIHVYDQTGYNPLFNFPDKVEGEEGYLYQPVCIYVTDNQVYVTDIGDYSVKIYSTEGQYLRSVGSYGNYSGQFQRPKGLSVDRQGKLYVIDAAFENAQLFNKDGAFLMFFGGSYRNPGDMYLPAGIEVDYTNMEFFHRYVDPDYKLKYLIFVTNQFGPDKINVYGFVGPE